jgi:hypothetical protein
MKKEVEIGASLNINNSIIWNNFLFKSLITLTNYINQLIFNTTDVFNVRNIFIQLNNGLSTVTNKSIIDAESQSNSDQNKDTMSKQMIGKKFVLNF